MPLRKIIAKKLSDFFTDREISKYSGMRYEEPNKIEFPLVFNMIQVSDDQWIGSLNVDAFCALQESGLINYNPVTQRAMTKVTRDNNELYRITLNKSDSKRNYGRYVGTYLCSGYNHFEYPER